MRLQLLAVLGFGSTALCLANETPATREYFYVGGEYVSSGKAGSVIQNQIYVEHLVPQCRTISKYPIVFWHGQAQTGTNWLNTPDGRQGWASYFLSKCYELYIVDQPQRGRSSWVPDNGQMAVLTAEILERFYTAVQKFGTWPQARLHTQWPGNGTRGDPIFDQFAAAQVQYQTNSTQTSLAAQKAGAALLDRINKPVVLLSHSQGGPHSFLIADARPDLVKTIVTLEPQGPPFQDRITSNSTVVVRPWGITDVSITYDPPVADPRIDLASESVAPTGPGLTDCLLQKNSTSGRGGPRKLKNLAKVPIAVVMSEASFFAGFDYCEVRYLRQAGVKVDHLDLPKLGIKGNGHFMFLEKNNLQIAGLVEGWIRNTTRC